MANYISKFTGAEVDNLLDAASIQPDWNQNDNTALDYIKNRPCYTEPDYGRSLANNVNIHYYSTLVYVTLNGENYYLADSIGATSYNSSAEAVTLLIDKRYYASFTRNGETVIFREVMPVNNEIVEYHSGGSTKTYRTGYLVCGDYIFIETIGDLTYNPDFELTRTHAVNMYMKQPGPIKVTLKREIGDAVTKLPTKYIDTEMTPVNASEKPITSGGVYTALASKQNTLTFDSTPTSGSTNPVMSSGIYDAISELALIVATNQADITSLQNANESQASTISSLMSEINRLKVRVTALEESGNSGDGTSITFEDGALSISGNGVNYSDGVVDIAVNRVTYDNGVVEITTGSGGGGGSAVDAEISQDGTANISGTGVTFENGTLSINGGTFSNNIFDI